jgi:chemotaxis protein methyltransferase CheR
MSTSAPAITTTASELTADNYGFLQQHLYRNSGIVLENGKSYLIEARLLPIVARRRLGTLNDLCALLKVNAIHPVHREVVDALTINETLFFRDASVWQALKNTVLPEIVESRKQVKRLRFWSAAASSGQEAYSLSILLHELGLTGWDVQILGTDISSRMVERARTGLYSQLEVNRGLPASYLVKHFVRHGLDWQIRPEVKAWVRFEQLDIRQSLRSLGPFDIVFCRNILIYFDRATKERTLREIRGTIFRGGCMVLGSAETTLNADDSFQRRPIGQATFHQVS